MSNSFQVPPLSRLQIRNVALEVRSIAKRLTGADDPFFPIILFLDVYLPRHVPEFVLEILPESAMEDAHGYTYPDRHLIQVGEDVYQRAHRGEGRDRLTMAHELGHYVLHAGIGLARRPASASVAAYRCSEWQANAFGGELLVSVSHIRRCRSPAEAALLFGVSLDAAEYQWQVFTREGLI